MSCSRNQSREWRANASRVFTSAFRSSFGPCRRGPSREHGDFRGRTGKGRDPRGREPQGSDPRRNGFGRIVIAAREELQGQGVYAGACGCPGVSGFSDQLAHFRSQGFEPFAQPFPSSRRERERPDMIFARAGMRDSGFFDRRDAFETGWLLRLRTRSCARPFGANFIWPATSRARTVGPMKR